MEGKMKNQKTETVRATAKEVMAFFGYEDASEFRSEWVALTDAERQFFQAEVAKILAANL
jgi:hypothetical protein